MMMQHIPHSQHALTLFSAFLIGLLGSTHCFGMCGGISSALSLNIAKVGDAQSQPLFRVIRFQCYYNAGRIFTYAVIGAIAGLLGVTLMKVMGPSGPMFIRRSAGVILVALGLYLAGFWMGLRRLEQWGSHLWRYLSPLTKHFIPVQSFWQAILVGGLWGWLPCGLVYSTLALASTGGSWFMGAGLMLSFGLGTLPMLLVTGSLAERCSHIIRHRNTRRVSGILVILCGVWTIF